MVELMAGVAICLMGWNLRQTYIQNSRLTRVETDVKWIKQELNGRNHD